MDSILYNNEAILPTLEEAAAMSSEILLGS